MIRSKQRYGTRYAPLALLATLAVASPGLADEAPQEGPRAEMHLVFEAVSELLPVALNEEDWSDPVKREETMRWLDALAARTAVLEQHTMSRDVGFQHLSRSLASDIEEVRERYRRGRYEESRFFMIETTGNCVACHGRLPSARSFPMANRLLARIDVDSLSVHERTAILVATRQFDEAMSAWEGFFRDPDVPPGEFDLGGYLLDYMTIGLRVESDPERVRKTLDRLAERADVPLYLKRHLRGWSGALSSSGTALASEDRLGQARSLVLERGAHATPFARDQIVHDLVASSLLLRLLDQKDIDEGDRAEAYYLLGLVESRTVDSHWVPQAEVHLESAIRLAPGAPFAEDAYAVLEEYVIVGWGGASATDLPADQWAKLQELRSLIDSNTASPAPGGEANP